MFTNKKFRYGLLSLILISASAQCFKLPLDDNTPPKKSDDKSTTSQEQTPNIVAEKLNKLINVIKEKIGSKSSTDNAPQSQSATATQNPSAQLKEHVPTPKAYVPNFVAVSKQSTSVAQAVALPPVDPKMSPDNPKYQMEGSRKSIKGGAIGFMVGLVCEAFAPRSARGLSTAAGTAVGAGIGHVKDRKNQAFAKRTKGRTLHGCVAADDVDGFLAYVETGAALDELDDNGRSVYHVAAANGSTKVLSRVHSYTPYYKRIDGYSARFIDLRDTNGKTAALIAAERGDAEATAKLCNLYGASKYMNDHVGNSVCSIAQKNPKIRDILKN